MMFWSLTLCDKQRKMLTQEFRTFIHNMEKEFGGDEDNDPVIVERIQRTLRIIFETLVRNGLEDRYTSDRALQHLRSDLRVSLEQEDLLPYGLMFFSSGESYMRIWRSFFTNTVSVWRIRLIMSRLTKMKTKRFDSFGGKKLNGGGSDRSISCVILVKIIELHLKTDL